MKINFKKIASVIATTVMLGSTIAFASAAFPEPFVKSGAADAALVVGASAAATDNAAAVDIGAALDAKVTVASTGTSASEGDKVKLEDGTNLFNLGEYLNTFYTSLDNENLAVVLADGTYLNQDNNDYEYEQNIVLAADQLVFARDKDYNDNKPAAGFFLSKGDSILNYTLEFSTDAECGTSFNDCDNTELKMLGKTFFISNAEGVGDDVKLTMLDTANLATVAEGETKTVTVGDKSYEVSIDFIASPTAGDEVKLNINGQVTNTLNEGETYKLTDGTFVGIKDISYASKETGISKVEFSLGMGKLVVQNGEEVELNEEKLSTLKDANGVKSKVTAYITNVSGTDLQDLTLEWTLSTDAIIAPGADLTLPGFEAIKLSMSGFNAPKAEITSLEDSSDALVVDTEIKDGAISLPILYANSTQSGFEGIGEDSDHVLVTNGTSATTAYKYITLNMTNDAYCVLTWINGDEGESYAFQISDIDEGTDGKKNATTLDNLAGGTDVVLSEVTDTKTVGNKITLILQAANAETEVAVIGYKAASSGTVYTDKLVTKEGLTMRLPVFNRTMDSAVEGGVVDGQININATHQATSWVMNFTEEDSDGNIDQADSSFTVTLGVNADDGTQPTAVGRVNCGTSTTCPEEDDSDWYVGMLSSELATKVRLYDPSGDSLGKAEVIYAGEQSSADVYIAESAVTFSGSNAVKVVTDDEADSVKDKNLIVVGGSCINTVAASLLGSSAPMCGSDFSAKTTVGAGQYLIQVFNSPYATSGKVAMLVAGYDAADTTAAAKYVSEGKFTDTTVGKKVIGPVVGTA